MKINVKEQGFFSGYGIEKKDVFFVLILILIAIFGFSFNASASVVAPPTGSVLYNLWTSTGNTTYLSATNVNTIFDTDFNYLGGWANIVYYNGNLYNPCLPAYESIRYSINIYNNAGVRITGRSSSAYYSCVGGDFTFTTGPSGNDHTPAYWVNDYITQYSPTYVLIGFGYEWSISPYTAKALIYIDEQNNHYLLNDDFSEYSNVVGLPNCGSDAGKLIETTPINLCDVGTAGTVIFDGSKWNWDCISGAASQSCRAYLATTEPVDGTCGAWNGETFNTWPPVTELCELRTSLVVPSMVETINGYTWTCSGINGGTSDYCSGNKTSPPLMPELPAGSLDDCSGLSILEGLICNIGNTLKTIFLPSSEKINELNQTINKMGGKFPFSYISKATETFNDLKGNIAETSLLELSIMESEKSSIDFSTIAFFDYIKMLTTTLIIIVFSFWLIRFIKHIF